MLISESHRQRYQQHYATQAALVLRPHRWQPLVDQLVQEVGATSVLDYGCGPAGNLARYAAYPVRNYDPGVPAFQARPQPADVVVCVHTLEHIEPACLDAVLWDIWRLAQKAIYCTIPCQVSTKVLADGTPWHTIVHPSQWWQARLGQMWGVTTPMLRPSQESPMEYACIWRCNGQSEEGSTNG